MFLSFEKHPSYSILDFFPRQKIKELMPKWRMTTGGETTTVFSRINLIFESSADFQS